MLLWLYAKTLFSTGTLRATSTNDLHYYHISYLSENNFRQNRKFKNKFLDMLLLQIKP